VTGGARGIGEAYVISLLDHGYKVVIIDILNAENKANELAKKYGSEHIIGITCDVTDKVSYNNAFMKASKFSNDGILDIVVLNAGILRFFFNDAKKVIDTNLLAPMQGSEIYINQLTNNLKNKANKRGLIIITASISGVISRSINLSPVYDASKAGLVQFVRGMKPIGEYFNFRINAICPNTVDTQLIAPYKESLKNIKDVGKLMKPNDITHSLLRIVDDKLLNGDILVVTYDNLQGKIQPTTINNDNLIMDDIIKARLKL